MLLKKGLYIVEFLTREVFDHLKIIKLPQLWQLLFIDSEYESFVVALVFVYDLGLALYSHYLIFNHERTSSCIF